MAYRIIYDSAHNQHNRSAYSRGRLLIFVCLIYICFLGMTFQFWPEGRVFMMRLIFPGGDNEAGYAIEAFADNLKDGMDFSQALHVFGRDVIYSGKMGY